MLSALTSILIAYAENALYLWTRVVVCIESVLCANLIVHCRLLLLAEVHTASKLTDADEVSTLHDLILKR